jgi:hypothetical protein
MVNSTSGSSQDPYYLQNAQPPSSGAPADNKTLQFLADLENEIAALTTLESSLKSPQKQEAAALIKKLEQIKEFVTFPGSLSDIKTEFPSVDAEVNKLVNTVLNFNSLTQQQVDLAYEIQASEQDALKQVEAS